MKKHEDFLLFQVLNVFEVYKKFFFRCLNLMRGTRLNLFGSAIAIVEDPGP